MQIRKQVRQEQDVRYRGRHFAKEQGLDGLEIAEAAGDGDTVEGREVDEVEDQTLERFERGEMRETASQEGGVNQLPQRVREPQHTRVRSDSLRP